MPETISPGDPYPLGATWDGSGTNFAVFSQSRRVGRPVPVRRSRQRDPLRAARGRRLRVARLPGRGRARPAVRLPGPRGLRPRPGAAGQLRQAPARPLRQGHIGRGAAGASAVYSYPLASGDDRIMDKTDSAASMPKSMVVDTAFDWADDHRPRTPWHDTVIYETHVRGLTWRHPEVPPPQRGTYAGVAHPEMIEHFQRLGHHRRRADAGPPVRRRPRPGRNEACATTGATTRSASSPPTTATPPGRANEWSTSSRPWCAPCTPPGSRSSSTSSTTTRPRATTWGRR